MIEGIIGPQGSGKTSFMAQYGRKFKSLGGLVYTNMNIQGFINIRDYSEIPYNRRLKLLMIDEAMFSLDSRSFSSKDNKVFTRFLAYCRKINCALLWCTHRLTYVDVRLQDQTDLFYFLKKCNNKTAVCAVDAFDYRTYTFSIDRSREFFEYCNYDTYDMPCILHTAGLLKKPEFAAI